MCIRDSLSAGTYAVVSIEAPFKSNIEDAHNEDSYLICEPSDGSTILAIADGAGGYSGGKEASRLAFLYCGPVLIPEKRMVPPIGIRYLTRLKPVMSG